MDEFVSWLNGCLDEDERIVRAATAGPWRHSPDKHHHIVGTPQFEEAVFAGSAGVDAVCVAGTGETDDQQSMRDAAHIAEWDPARVLREIAGKRELLARFNDLRDAFMRDGSGGDVLEEYQELILLQLARPFEDRPGFAEAVAFLG